MKGHLEEFLRPLAKYKSARLEIRVSMALETCGYGLAIS